ncbi:LysR family transcriptional regulator [Nocardioides sp.]|uniref:LysR family transcriptional regulator n=1 Tax=Nocardioides sp. TaxID=35761 RepID=UPI003D0D3478
MNVELLHTFLTVARLGSVTAAAHHLGYSQPTVSQQVSRLECLLNERLLVRGSGAMTLTDAGQRVVPLARVMIVAYGELTRPTGRVPR